MRFRRGVAAIVIAPLAVCACDVIIGLNKYCGDDCPDAGAFDGGFDAPIDSSDAASDVVDIPDVLDEATSWARWPMENTLAEIQAEAGPSPKSLASFAFVDAGAGAVIDQITGLTWSLSAMQVTTIEAAAAFCAGLQPSGFRVPTRIELVSLLDTTRMSRPFIEQPFVQPLQEAGASSGDLWTASYARPAANPLRYWFVNVGTDGSVFPSTPNQAGVLCVR